MSGTSLRRLLTVAASTAALGAAVAVPSPAAAGEMFFSKRSSTIVTTSWVEIGPLPGVLGNAHVGDLQVEDLGRGRTRLFGFVVDLDCEPGQPPIVPGGGHGEPPAEGEGCAVVGERFIEGGRVSFTIDRKLTRAALTGTLAVGGHGGPTVSPPVNITWTGVGGTFSERVVDSGVDEFGTYRLSYSFTGREADVAPGSKIGAMVFDDVEGETSEARMGTQRSSDRFRG